ncbi:MAG: cell division protein CrgA [Acidimicrobiales bacterium]
MAERTARRSGPAKAGRGPGRATKPTAGGRATPKGTTAVKPAKGHKTRKPPRAEPDAGIASGRYTPPIPRNKRRSPAWVPILMLTLLVVGVLVIIVNYLAVLPGGASNWYLLAGLVLICAGFVAATQYR